AGAILAGLVFIYLIRSAIAAAYRKSENAADHVSRWDGLYVAGVTLSGLAWGIATAAVIEIADVFPGMVGLIPLAAMMLCMVIVCAGSVGATGGFLASAAFPPMVVLAAMRDQNHITAAVALALLAALLYVGARVLRALLNENFLVQGENEQLTQHLDQRRNQVEKLNVALKTNMDKREQAEMNLRRASADLGLVKGKAAALAETLERVSPYCTVTGLTNRRRFAEMLDTEWRRDQRERRPVSLLVVAIDHFDEYVETYGRQSGDALLKKVGTMVKGFGRRAGDIAARYGEAQFSLLLPGADMRNVARISEALRKRVESQQIAHAGAPQRDKVTAHMGSVTMIPTRSMDVSELIKRVESSLYEARFQGGNKVIAYQPLDKLKLTRWNRKDDGPLNEQALIQKLLLWGYDTDKSILKPDTPTEETTYKEETIIAVLTGRLQLTIEGSLVSVTTGDCLFVPGGTGASIEVESDEPVVCFTATRGK
ncbi:MAG: diguanylate cyclase, partial [Gammaproteobacteria bacterium]|nr:diguanylate cyclase [Gammaproteobacteria bacterium]